MDTLKYMPQSKYVNHCKSIPPWGLQMKIGGIPQLNISYLQDKNKKIAHFNCKKSSFLPDFSAIL